MTPSMPTCSSAEKNRVQPLLVFFFVLPDKTRSSNICHLPSVADRFCIKLLRIALPVLTNPLELCGRANRSTPPPVAQQYQNWNRFLPQFLPPSQRRNYGAWPRPAGTVLGLL